VPSAAERRGLNKVGNLAEASPRFGMTIATRQWYSLCLKVVNGITSSPEVSMELMVAFAR